MKTLYTGFILLSMGSLLSGGRAFAAPINYTFQAVAGTYTANASPNVIIGGGDDDLGIPYFDIGFTFYFGCQPYTGFSLTNNGWMSLDPDCTDFHTVNNLSTSTSSNGFSPGRPIIAPLWDDLSVNFSGGNVNYQLTGAAGSRVLTVEWNRMNWHWTGASATISFQAKLYEGTNIIEFVYRQDAGAVAGTRTASIGLGGLNTGDYYTLNGTGVAPAASKATNTTNLSTRPATGQVYRWTPVCGSLPVDLLSFGGDNRLGGSLLKWVTVSESQNDFFTVEKSIDGTEFFDLARVDGAGNSDKQAKYSITDNKPAALTYYRLSQTDFNGTQRYYETIMVINKNEAPPVHPNPANEFVFLEAEEASTYTLYNSAGILVSSGILDKNQSLLDVSKLAEGLYLLRMNDKPPQMLIIRH